MNKETFINKIYTSCTGIKYVKFLEDLDSLLSPVTDQTGEEVKRVVRIVNIFKTTVIQMFHAVLVFVKSIIFLKMIMDNKYKESGIN